MKIKRLARYMISFEEVTFEYEWQSEEEAIKLRGFTDSDWQDARRPGSQLQGER